VSTTAPIRRVGVPTAATGWPKQLPGGMRPAAAPGRPARRAPASSKVGISGHGNAPAPRPCMEIFRLSACGAGFFETTKRDDDLSRVEHPGSWAAGRSASQETKKTDRIFNPPYARPIAEFTAFHRCRLPAAASPAILLSSACCCSDVVDRRIE